MIKRIAFLITVIRLLTSVKVMAEGPVYNFNFYNATESNNLKINSKSSKTAGKTYKGLGIVSSEHAPIQSKAENRTNWSYELFADFSVHNQDFKAHSSRNSDEFHYLINEQSAIGVAYRFFDVKFSVGYSELNVKVQQSGYPTRYWEDVDYAILGKLKDKLKGYKISLEYDKPLDMHRFGSFAGFAFSSFDIGNIDSKLNFYEGYERLRTDAEVNLMSLFVGLKYRFRKISLYGSVGGTSSRIIMGKKEEEESRFTEKYVDVKNFEIGYSLKLAYDF